MWQPDQHKDSESVHFTNAFITNLIITVKFLCTAGKKVEPLRAGLHFNQGYSATETLL